MLEMLDGKCNAKTLKHALVQRDPESSGKVEIRRLELRLRWCRSLQSETRQFVDTTACSTVADSVGEVHTRTHNGTGKDARRLTAASG